MAAEWDAFLAAIVANPADDAVRLIAADWLTDHGEPERGEFVRVQCELAKTLQWLPTECDVCGNTADEDGSVNHGRGCYVESEDGGGSTPADENPRWDYLRRRERELWCGPAGVAIQETMRPFNIGVWLASEPPVWPYTQALVSRGFPAEVRLPLAAWCGRRQCLKCHGRGFLPSSEVPGDMTWVHTTTIPDVRCPHCRGSGRFGALGPALVVAAPVQVLAFTDQPPPRLASRNPEEFAADMLSWARGATGLPALAPI